MTVEETKTLLKSEVLKDVQKGIEEFANYVAKNSDKKQNATYAFFDIDKKTFGDEKLIPLEELDAILKTFEDQLNSNDLVNIVISTLSYNIRDNFITTLSAIKILLKRKDVVGQNAVVESFKKACKYYDAGHRYWGNTVQDQLIDNLFPEFEGEPLVNLLCWCENYFLSAEEGDRLDELFIPAFEKIKNITELENKLLTRFKNYVFEWGGEGLDDGGLHFSKILEGYENTSPKVQAAIQSLKTSKINYAEANSIAVKVKNIIAEQLAWPNYIVQKNTNIKEAGIFADELNGVEILKAIEHEFRIELNDNDETFFRTADTVGDIVSYIENILNKQQ